MRTNTILCRLIGALVMVLLTSQVWSTSSEEDDDPDWFEMDIHKLTREVNEGELEFLTQTPKKVIHHHQNNITIGARSLQDGWVQLRQCHHDIGNVGRAQILFREGRIRNLRVVETQNIKEAWVEGASVQLQIDEKQSLLCVEAESLAMTATDDGSYLINNGPFMRRFLDGYYPMRVSMQIELSDSGLRFNRITPESQPGFVVQSSDKAISFEALFEGRLRTEIELKPANSPLAAH